MKGSIDKFSISDKCSASLMSQARTSESVGFGGIFIVECFKPDGTLRWRDTAKNLVPNVALQHILDILFVSATAQIDPFYIGLTATTPSPAAGDTMGSHVGWTEFEDYDEVARQTYVDVRSSQTVTNAASKGVFTIDTNSSVIGGAFLTEDDTKGGSSDLLLCCAAFTLGDKNADDDDVLNVEYQFTAADA